MDTDKTRTTYTPKGTPIGRVRGLGAGHHGTHDWLLMRYTSVASLLLGAFLLVSLALMPDMTFGTVSEWLSRPVPAAAMALLVVSVFWHTRLGVAEMIGDYVHTDGNKFAAILALNLAIIGGAGFALFCIARLAFGGGAA